MTRLADVLFHELRLPLKAKHTLLRPHGSALLLSRRWVGNAAGANVAVNQFERLQRSKQWDFVAGTSDCSVRGPLILLPVSKRFPVASIRVPLFRQFQVCHLSELVEAWHCKAERARVHIRETGIYQNATLWV